MKKKDKDAFLKSIFETSPIKKKNRVEKEIPRNTENILKKTLKKKYKHTTMKG
jgi:predicted HAD superfamily phosphohydrolase YqeG